MSAIISFLSLASIIAITCAGLAGCTTKPTIGERMLSQGAGTADLGTQWVQGQAKVAKGEKLIKKAEAKTTTVP